MKTYQEAWPMVMALLVPAIMAIAASFAAIVPGVEFWKMISVYQHGGMIGITYNSVELKLFG